MPGGYKEDIAAAITRQQEIVKKQVMLEIIQIAATCETYEEFRKAMYGTALGYLKEFEDDGVIKPGTVEAAKEGKLESKEDSDVDIIS